MKTPAEMIQGWKKYIMAEWKLAFGAALLVGFLVHLPMMLSDIPNHDGLDSLYFDQNMITSGRWFLTVACGLTSYYSLPWLIGILAIFWLGLTAVVLVAFLEVQDRVAIVLISSLLMVFPALASTFAYAFTMDGYMLALFLAAAAALCVKKWKWGFVPGAVCLAFSLGTYQAYLPFAVILSIYGILMQAMSSATIRDKFRNALRYLYMGILGLALYYSILQLLLKIQGKELASYQGIEDLGRGPFSGGIVGLLQTIRNMYYDFFAFSLRGNVLMNNLFSTAAVIGLLSVTIIMFVRLAVNHKWWKNPWFYILLTLLVVVLPPASNLIQLISSGVSYHLLMRYQWVLYLILPIAFIARYRRNQSVWADWCVLLCAAVLVINYAVTDNIAYSNLQKRYEKTYAYCVRLLDRIEQTPGYYQGIPIAMIGVVSDESYPMTDITQDVTSNMIGMNGDVLLYTGNNYELFIRNYLGATLNILPPEVMEEIYYSEEYRAMDSFPGADSVKLVDGVIYVKTENIEKAPVEEKDK